MGQKRVRVKEPERDRKMTKGKHAETTHGQRTLRAVVEGENGRWKYTETPTTDSNKRNDRNNVETRERPSARITRNVRRPGQHTSVVVGIGGRRVRVALRLPLPRPRGNENVSVSSFLFCFFGFFFLPSLFSPPIFRSEKRGRARLCPIVLSVSYRFANSIRVEKPFIAYNYGTLISRAIRWYTDNIRDNR